MFPDRRGRAKRIVRGSGDWWLIKPAAGTESETDLRVVPLGSAPRVRMPSPSPMRISTPLWKRSEVCFSSARNAAASEPQTLSDEAQ